MISCDGGRCALRGAVTLDNVMDVLAAGRELLTAPDLTVDLQGVTEVDSSALSLMLEWRREAARAGRTLRYVNLPANLMSLAELYDVTELVGVGE